MKQLISDKIRENHESGLISDVEAARRLFYKGHDVRGAKSLLKNAFIEAPRAILLEEFGNISSQSANNMEAEMAYMSTLFRFGDLHTANLIRIGYPAVAAHVDTKKRVLYIPIPKCASSTIKNYLSVCNGGEDHGERIHVNMNVPRTLVTLEDMRGKYAGFFKFAVIRDPIQRVTSYLGRNLQGGALKRTAYGADSFRGLPTTPEPTDVAAHFGKYRQYYLDFRHHTNSQISYLWPFIGNDPEFHIFTMGGVATVREKLEKIYQCQLPEIRAMSSSAAPNDKITMSEQLDTLRNFYHIDYEIFGKTLENSSAADPISGLRKWNPRKAATWTKAMPYHSVLPSASENRRVKRLAKRAIRRIFGR